MRHDDNAKWEYSVAFADFLDHRSLEGHHLIRLDQGLYEGMLVLEPSYYTYASEE